MGLRLWVGKKPVAHFGLGMKKCVGWVESLCGGKELSTQPTQSFIHYKLRKKWYCRNPDISEKL